MPRDQRVIHQTLDTSGQCCPLPMLAVTKALAALPPGAVLEVIATDPASRFDIPVGVHRLGHDLLDLAERDGKLWFRIMRC